MFRMQAGWGHRIAIYMSMIETVVEVKLVLRLSGGWRDTARGMWSDGVAIETAVVVARD